MTPFLWLDFDGVLRHWPARLFGLSESELSQIQAAAFLPQLLIPAITGQNSDEKWRERTAERLAKELGIEESQRRIDLWSAPCGEIDHGLLARVKQIGFEGRIGLITNATSRLDADLRRLGLDQEFTHVINSSALGSAKPDPTAFQHALSLSGRQALFADDSIKNCMAAEAAGLPSHHFTSPSAFEAWLLSAL